MYLLNNIMKEKEEEKTIIASIFYTDIYSKLLIIIIYGLFICFVQKKKKNYPHISVNIIMYKWNRFSFVILANFSI